MGHPPLWKHLFCYWTAPIIYACFAAPSTSTSPEASPSPCMPCSLVGYHHWQMDICFSRQLVCQRLFTNPPLISCLLWIPSRPCCTCGIFCVYSYYFRGLIQYLFVVWFGTASSSHNAARKMHVCHAWWHGIAHHLLFCSTIAQHVTWGFTIPLYAPPTIPFYIIWLVRVFRF